MHLNKLLIHLSALLLLATTSAWANNVTLSGVFDGSEAPMVAAPSSCNDTPKHYKVAGTITVSARGSYTFVDAGNWFPTVTPQAAIADTVIMIYSDSFDSVNPENNRVAIVDEFDTIELNPDVSYILVVQHWCAEINGAYAIVIDAGGATISGDGFTSLPQTIGQFDESSPTANFTNQGVRRYRSDAISVSTSGPYYFFDMGEEMGGSTLSLRIYKDSFDPLNPDANMVINTHGTFISSFSLRTGVNYVFVVLENEFQSQRLQYVLFPPGEINFNPGLNGAWTAEGIKHQGIMMEVIPSAGILFFAQFTFVDQLVIATQSSSPLAAKTEGGGGSKVQAQLGAADQIWLTAFGSIPASGLHMAINYENSTGGRFNSEEPDATLDSNYGIGWIDLIACDHMVINWDLPGGIVDTRDYYKSEQDSVPYCESFVKAVPVSPDW